MLRYPSLMIRNLQAPRHLISSNAFSSVPYQRYDLSLLPNTVSILHAHHSSPSRSQSSTSRPWQNLFSSHIPISGQLPKLSLDAASIRTAPYSAMEKPPMKISPTFYVPDSLMEPKDTIIERFKDAYEHGIATVHTCLPPFPHEEFKKFTSRTSTYLSEPISDEGQVLEIFADTCYMATSLAEEIHTAAQSSPPAIVRKGGVQRYSQKGDRDIHVETGDISYCFSIEAKRPDPLVYHSRRLEQGGSLNAQESASDHCAMAIKLALQMSVAEPQWSQFGGFVAGPYFMLTELVELGSNKGTALLTSPLFSITATSLESEQKFCERPESTQSRKVQSIPTQSLLACVVTLMSQALPAFQIREVPQRTISNALSSLPQARKLSPTDFSPVPNTVKFDSPLEDIALYKSSSRTPLSVAIDHPSYSNVSTLVVPVTFIPRSTPTADNGLLIPELSPSPWETLPAQKHPPHITWALRAFLATNFKELNTSFGIPILPEFKLSTSSHYTPLPIKLYERIGEGRTAAVWRAKLGDDYDRNHSPRYVVKLMSAEHTPSVVREALFYEVVFPFIPTISSFVPKYHGTFVNPDSSWYIILLEDVGDPVKGAYDFGSVKLANSARQLEKAFRDAGIEHGDIAPRNVLRGRDGKLRLIDFGLSRLVGPPSRKV